MADRERTRDGAHASAGDDAADGTPDPTPKPDHRPAGHARNRFQTRGWRIATPLVFGLSGALFLISAASSDGNDLRPGRVTTMASLVRNESRQVEDLQAEARGLRQQVDDLSAAVDDETVQRARNEARGKRAAAGFEPVSGPGVTVTLADAPRDVREESDRDLNRLVVHQQDIQAVVNAMWDAGAQAVTIQGQRIISTTGIKCAGNSVELHGIPYPQPYVIKAVGDPAELEARIGSDPYVNGYRQDAADPTIQVGWSMEQESSIDAPAYGGIQALQYARPAS
ncbi:DUF881 domain-containing protein [Nocardioides guangzhouensis]|uniref:DUF881 domain-containing protein n=2 Tax=Nocardioides guangzhouensis TaxID=2497878 RepID=A0A4Q4Z4C8_9ACTN|nr:DUF881 domain-containing protein [Nocardioides guangzhouensis]